MQHVGGVYVLQTTQNLVHKILNMVNSKRLLAIYNTVQICFHQILYNVYVFKLFGGRRRRYNINNANDLKKTAVETLSFQSVSVAHSKKLTFSCENFFISLISRRIRFASTGSSKALEIFLIATFSPVSLSRADITTPYAP